MSGEYKAQEDDVVRGLRLDHLKSAIETDKEARNRKSMIYDIKARDIPSDPEQAEQYAHEQIRILHQEFQMKAQPFVILLGRLVNAKQLPALEPFITDGEVADELRRLADIARSQERAQARIQETLKWYGEQARLCRLIHSEGDKARNALAADGGKRAQDALRTDTSK